jgi:drug/metabolite transporter (DMT)-like permease
VLVTIGLGISVPLIVIAFNVDRIAYLFYKMRGFENHLLTRKLFLLVALAIPPSILAPIWTSELSMGAKIAATTVLATLGLGFVLSIGIWYTTHVALRRLGASTLTTTKGSS